MTVLRQNEEILFELGGTFDKRILSVSVSSLKSVPRVNFKKIKLSKFQNLEDALKTKNITRILLDEKILETALSETRHTEKELVKSSEFGESKYISPLRKKNVEKEESIEQLAESFQKKDSKEEKKIEEKKIVEEKLIQETDDDLGEQEDEIAVINEKLQEEVRSEIKQEQPVTFNLDAQIVQEEENVILSPSTVSLPPFKEDIISTSGEQTSFVWPPLEHKTGTKKKKNKKNKNLKKPYFLKTDDWVSSEIVKREPEEIRKEEKPVENLAFPWLSSKQDYFGLDDIVQGSLESELLDVENTPIVDNLGEISKKKEEPAVEKFEELIFKNKAFEEESKIIENIRIEEIKLQPGMLKALAPEIPDDLLQINVFKDEPGSVNSNVTFTNPLELPSNIEVSGKAKNMFDKLKGGRLSPVGIILLGGLTATLSYLAWIYVFPEVVSRLDSRHASEKIVIRNLPNKIPAYNKNSALLRKKQILENKKNIQALEQKRNEEENKIALNLITDKDRETSIQTAREALEERLDPFGEEQVLPPVIETSKDVKEEDKPPPEINLERKQVELVGILSTIDKNLALVNVYTVDYSVVPSDDKAARETKLKTSLGMAVPDRVEVSLLDPIEDWYVKQIIKSKSRSDDPMIELVRGDKKFKLKVGQKLLLPEDKPFDEVLAEHLEKYGSKNKSKNEEKVKNSENVKDVDNAKNIKDVKNDDEEE